MSDENNPIISKDQPLPTENLVVKTEERNPSEALPAGRQALAKGGNMFINSLNNLPKKLIENKKTVIIIGIVFGIFVVLALLLSVISRNVKNIVSKKVVESSPTPTPIEQIVDLIKVSTVAGELSTFKDQLINLKGQIDGLDIDQSRLSPPSINFKINFDVKK